MSLSAIAQIDKDVDPYARIKNRIICDQRLSWKARGILAYLISKPQNWEIRIRDVVARGPDGLDAVQSAFKELERFGYAKLVVTGNGSRWKITDKMPHAEDPHAENRHAENPRVENRHAYKQKTLQTTDITNKRENMNGSLFPEIKKVGKRPTLMELKAYCSEKGLSPRDAEWLDAKWEGNGFKNNGKPITSWRGTISQWEIQKIFPSQKDKPHGGNCI